MTSRLRPCNVHFVQIAGWVLFRCQALILWVYTRAANLPCAVLLQRCAEMQHSEVRIVKGVDDRLTGEAYVHISGARAKLRLALAKDRTLMPVRYSLPPISAQRCASSCCAGSSHCQPQWWLPRECIDLKRSYTIVCPHL